MRFTLLAAYCWHLRNKGVPFSGELKFRGQPVKASGALSFLKQHIDFDDDSIGLSTKIPDYAVHTLVDLPLSRVIELAPCGDEDIDQAIIGLNIDEAREGEDSIRLKLSLNGKPLPLFEINMPWEGKGNR